jgi:hypothetical protein
MTVAASGAVLASGSSGGAMGFLVILLLILATVFLIRSMSKRLANVRRNADNWPDLPDEAHESDPEGP